MNTHLRLTACFASLILSASAANLPAMAMCWTMPPDEPNWNVVAQDSSDSGHTIQLMPADAPPPEWKEILVQQTTFTPVDVRLFVDLYKGLLNKSDRGAQVSESVNKDDTITLTVTSTKTGLTSVRRFMRGRDGIYMLAYFVRTSLKSANTLARWTGVINGATLTPNPELKG